MKKMMLVATSGLTLLSLQAAWAGVSADQAAQLKTTLTPFGSIRAGSADGLIPTWTGGDTTPVAGAPSNGIPSSPYAGDTKILTINANNYTQYQDKLSDGVIALIERYPGFHIDVYPTHRTAAAPQWVYDNIYQNALNSVPVAGGITEGFAAAYGGIPFPIFDPTDPNAGTELVWDHMSRWQGSSSYGLKTAYVVNQGVVTLAAAWHQWCDDPYYQPNGSASTYNGYMTKYRFQFVGPPNLDGSAFMQWQRASGDANNLTTVWQYLDGQGRVREAPELTFDTPSGQTNDVSNYDEYFMFNASPAQYDWKYVGEKEVYIPYNNNDLFLHSPDAALKAHYIDPDFVRWELHRVYIVDGTLRPGSRNVMAKRVFYIDEDTHTIMLADEYDAKGNLYHVEMGFNEVRPDLPGTFLAATVVYNLITDQYTTGNGPWTIQPYVDPAQYYAKEAFSASLFNAQALAAQDQY